MCGPVAQLVEQRPFKAWVDGSNPSGLTSFPSRPFDCRDPSSLRSSGFGRATPASFKSLPVEIPHFVRDFACGLRRPQRGSSSNPSGLTRSTVPRIADLSLRRSPVAQPRHTQYKPYCLGGVLGAGCAFADSFLGERSSSMPTNGFATSGVFTLFSRKISRAVTFSP